jgi:hypothetical protein
MRKAYKYVGLAALTVFSGILLINSVRRVTYANSDTVAFSFNFETVVVGDSWSKRPHAFGAQAAIGQGCGSIEEIKSLVAAFDGQARTVYVAAGVANTACHDISIEDTIAQLEELVDVIKAHLHPKEIIVYDPRVMWGLLESPELCLAPQETPQVMVVGGVEYQIYDIHVNDLGYEKLLASEPLYIH